MFLQPHISMGNLKALVCGHGDPAGHLQNCRDNLSTYFKVIEVAQFLMGVHRATCKIWTRFVIHSTEARPMTFQCWK